jgi:hypothetical protein
MSCTSIPSTRSIEQQSFGSGSKSEFRKRFISNRKTNWCTFCLCRQFDFEKDKVTFSAQNQNLKQVLNGIFSNRNIDFSFSGNNQIVLKASPKSQDHTSVSGKITDAQTGDALPGVNVSVKGTSKGATSDANGNFKISISDKDAVLLFSFVGFSSQEVPIRGRNHLNVQLSEDNKYLNEVVVTALGIKREEKH